jgi:putative SOS response-associated peptidase YedK
MKEDTSMCYSAYVWGDYRKFVRAFGASISIKEFVDIFIRRRRDTKVKLPKTMEEAFLEQQTADLEEIRQEILGYRQEQANTLQQELFKQRKRLADAQRTLETKVTKAAQESQRIATDKVERILGKLADLAREAPKPRDSRIFPGSYAPVMVMEEGQLVVKPMRYLCRPSGRPAFYDTKYPGTYNARRDNLGGFWKELFGATHGIVVLEAFFENVSRHRVEGRELGPSETPENVVLEFRPRPQQPMFAACLWSRWSEPGQEELLSFAAITDEPPPEVSRAGHDRCVIPLRKENVEAWLSPQGRSKSELQDLLDDRPDVFYEHQLAA